MNKFPDSLLKKIEARKASDSFRTLMKSEGLVDFYSNDYLGVSEMVFSSDASSGSTGSRLISGNSDRTEEIENQIAEFFNQESALFFNSGYDANLGLFSSIPLKGDTVLYDSLIHASIRDGVRMSLATAFSFKHNDLVQLEEKLKRATGTIYVAIESTYSMDGDSSALQDISALCIEYGAYLIVDEAHSGGIDGPQGKGLVFANDLDNEIFAKVVTFGKAYGSHGAMVLGPLNLKNYLINYARSLIYTTALSPHSQERISNVVQVVSGMDAERHQLKRNITLFKSAIKEGEYKFIESDSAIQSVLIPGNSAAKSVATRLQKAGFAVKAILYPTVKEGSERIRICIHSFNTEKQITELTQLING